MEQIGEQSVTNALNNGYCKPRSGWVKFILFCISHETTASSLFTICFSLPQRGSESPVDSNVQITPLRRSHCDFSFCCICILAISLNFPNPNLIDLVQQQ